MKQNNNNNQSPNPTTQCRNCEHPFTGEVKFCPICGQKNMGGKASLWEIFGVFFSTIFNLESKFFMTMRDIFVPGKLTRLYFAGKRGRHFHPMRLFIITFLFLIAAIGLQMSRNTENSTINLFEGGEKLLQREAFVKEVDSLSKVVATQFPDDPIVQTAFDSLNTALTIDSTSGLPLDSLLRLNLVMSSTNIKGRDIIELSPDELIEKYNIESFWRQIFVRQTIKLLRDTRGFSSFLLSKAIWVMLAMMPFLALLFKLLYIRRSRYYVEHLIFSFHIHAFAFILFTISVLLEVFAGISWGFGVSILGVLVYTFFTMKRVYGQGVGKTFTKFIIVMIAYLFIFTLFLLVGSVIGMALF